ncbi:MAG: ABC transporter ATP-binding protein [Candidatus Omnitrophica bacterium]|nr:ABC transporter ATP-binding protein [Candidatus Omnitrophota bacterium]
MLIDACNIHKAYRNGEQRLEVLRGIDLSLDRGQIVAIVGPSGAGKSTLLHILGGLDEPSDGKVILDSTDLYAAGDEERSSIRNRRMGFIFQFYHLLAEFSALENVIMPALVGISAGYDRHNSDKAPLSQGLLEKKALDLLDSVGLKSRAAHRPSELSGGETQRVAIARALINSPDIVFCDEPTGNLDSKNAGLILELIRDLNKSRNQAFVIVTHNEELARFADRTVQIKDGILVS